MLDFFCAHNLAVHATDEDFESLLSTIPAIGVGSRLSLTRLTPVLEELSGIPTLRRYLMGYSQKLSSDIEEAQAVLKRIAEQAPRIAENISQYSICHLLLVSVN